MRNTLALITAAALVALPVALAPQQASASCEGRKTTGMVVGGIGGALVGNAVSKGSTGTILGGLGGAVLGHQVGKSGCARVVYRTRAASTASAAAQRQAAPRVYYDRYGNPIVAAPQPVLTASR